MFTGGGGAASESIWRQWHDRYELYFADADPASIAPIIPPARAVHIPFAEHPAFAGTVVGECRVRNIDAFVPGVDEELLRLDELRAFAPSLDVVAPRGQFVRDMLDKFRCMSILAGHGLAVPTTVLSTEAHRLHTPFILKPRSGRGSRHVMIISRHTQVAAYLELLDLQADRVIAQQRIEGQEYTVFVSADRNGALGRIIPVKVLKKRGITLQAVIDPEPRVIEYCRRAHEALSPDGPYNVQLMLDGTGLVFPFEINPRVSTTVCLAMAAGADPVAAYRGISESQEAPARLKLSRYWTNCIMGG